MGVFRGKGAQEREQVRPSGAPRDPEHHAITDLGVANDGATGFGWQFGPSPGGEEHAATADAATADGEAGDDEAGGPGDVTGTADAANADATDEVADELRAWLRTRRTADRPHGAGSPPG